MLLGKAVFCAGTGAGKFQVSSLKSQVSRLHYPLAVDSSRCFNAGMSDLEPGKLTWAALLGRWVELSQSALALPDDTRGRAWKAAVPDIVALQAVAMALGQAEELEAEQLALGLDRARILVERHAGHLAKLFKSEAMHPMLAELITDAEAAIARAEARG
jgi:hypothetical protein